MIESNFTEMCSQESNWQKASIGSGNGLAPNRRQAIIWTNADPVRWRIYAALGRDELNKPIQFQQPAHILYWYAISVDDLGTVKC